MRRLTGGIYEVSVEMCSGVMIYEGKSISKLQMDIELKQIKSTDLKNAFISQHNHPVH
jgi:hypothetical protein